ncbi:MAG: hypothetical protein QOE70_4524 [Chthoniobacter sp.]|jgi:hypothetical protein|nr:hypothetical protein [Chthoniobacter sp.]
MSPGIPDPVLDAEEARAPLAEIETVTELAGRTQ